MLGLVENMSYFVCSHCGERQEVFHHGVVYRDLDVTLLGEVPLDCEVSVLADRRRPLLLDESQSPVRAAFTRLADARMQRLDTR